MWERVPGIERQGRQRWRDLVLELLAELLALEALEVLPAEDANTLTLQRLVPADRASSC